MSDDWNDTPAERIVWAERLDGERVRFSALRVGDVFRAVFDDKYIDPATHEPSDVYAKVVEAPHQADGVECSQDFGWAVAIDYVEDVTDLKKALN